MSLHICKKRAFGCFLFTKQVNITIIKEKMCQERLEKYTKMENEKMDAKKIFLEQEGNAWYARNKEQLEKLKIGHGIKFLSDFLENEKGKDQLDLLMKSQWKILEVGSSYGYNLSYLESLFHCECHGIEPSLDAVEEGNKMNAGKAISLIQGTADELPYEDQEFDVVLLGFCMFWVDRKYLMRAYAEADRVLREGGLMVVIDFDTGIPYKRLNKHNENAYTYKMNYSKVLLDNPQYFLVEKKMFSHGGHGFYKDRQERISMQILYKEKEDDAYYKDESER